RLLTLHDGFDHLRRNRFYIGTVGEFWVGHDRGRVRVYQHHAEAFLAQRLARLHPGIIKFAALPDHDWTGADEQNFFELVIPRHCAAGTLGENESASRENRHPACRTNKRLACSSRQDVCSPRSRDGLRHYATPPPCAADSGRPCKSL